MTQEEKILVLQDISGRLLYDVVIHTNLEDIKLDKKHRYIGVLYYEDYSDEFKKRCNYDTNHFSIIVSGCHYGDVKPYLRPLSSMTKEECIELGNIEATIEGISKVIPNVPYYIEVASSKQIDWLNRKMFDYRGLIPMGLALEAPKGMYNLN